MTAHANAYDLTAVFAQHLGHVRPAVAKMFRYFKGGVRLCQKINHRMLGTTLRLTGRVAGEDVLRAAWAHFDGLMAHGATCAVIVFAPRCVKHCSTFPLNW